MLLASRVLRVPPAAATAGGAGRTNSAEIIQIPRSAPPHLLGVVYRKIDNLLPSNLLDG
jgi:hypothetical protein